MASQSEERQPSDGVFKLLASGKMGTPELVPAGSNYTFIAPVYGEDGEEHLAIYKPRKGEAPLWDFPDGTLYKREYAAYLLSQALGWGFIPPTVIRDGPHGIGTVQLYMHPQEESHFFSLRESHTNECQRIAAFDYIANNADRKASHCFLDTVGDLWSVDHGLTFHVDYKLRTVIWDWAGQPLPKDIASDLANLAKGFDRLEAELGPYITGAELQVFRKRIGRLVEAGKFPMPGAGRNTPWPIF